MMVLSTTLPAVEGSCAVSQHYIFSKNFRIIILALRYELLPWLGLKLQMQLAEEVGMSQVMLDGEFKVEHSFFSLSCQTQA